ncbi:allene oxide cyclase barrel-like domain-containing protein [Rhodococcus indonesiensis]
MPAIGTKQFARPKSESGLQAYDGIEESMDRTASIALGAAAMTGVAVLLAGCSNEPAATSEPVQVADSDPEVETESMNLKVANDQYAAPATEPTLGDMFVYSYDLVDENGTKAGDGGGHCQTVDIAGATITQQCVISNRLPGGQITAAALWERGKDLDMTITGGTGQYAGIRGELRATEIGSPNEMYRFTIRR